MTSRLSTTVILCLATMLMICAFSAHAAETSVFAISPAQGADGTIYAVSDDTLYAFDADGEPLWTCEVGAVIRSSPVVTLGGIVYLLTGNDSLTAVNQEGTVEWMLSDIAPSARTIALPFYWRFCIGGHEGVSSYLFNGSNLWQWASEREDEDNAYVSVAHDGTIYVTGTNNTHLYAVESDGTLRWDMESPSGEPFSAPAIDGADMVYVTCGGKLLKITPDNTVAWTCTGVNSRPLRGSPVIGEDSIVYVTDEDGLMHVIGSGGEVVTTYPIGSACAAEPLLGNDGMVYQCTANGDIYRIDPESGDVAAVGSAGGSVQASPVITTGSALCFGVHEDALVTVDIDASGYPERAPWPCYGADSSNSRKMDNPPVGSLSGTILFEGIGIPVVDAHISLSPGEYTATTGDDGYYRVSGIDSGTYTFTVEAFGMMPVTIEDVVITAWEETELNLTPPADRKYLKWRFISQYSPSMSNTAIADDGTIIVADQYDVLHALDIDGNTLWTYESNDDILDPVLFDTGIIVPSWDTIQMLDSNGTEQWTYDSGSSISTPVRTPDGTIVFCCSDATVRALDDDGSLLWSVDLPEIGGSQPVVGIDGSIYVCTGDGIVIAFSSNGEEKWTYTCPANITGPPAMDNKGNLYICTLDGLIALNRTGTLIWSYSQECTSTSPIVGANGIVYFGARDVFNAVRDGRLVWQYTLTDSEIVLETPVIGADGTVYFCTNKWRLYALTFECYLTWRYDKYGGFRRGLKLTPEGLLLFTGEDGELYAVQTQSYGYQEDAPWPCKGKDNRNSAIMEPVGDYARIIGTVRNAEDDTPLSGVTVTTTPGGIAATTNSKGHYDLFVTAPGSYSIEAEAPGWIPSTIDGIEVNADDEVTVDFTLTYDVVRTRWRTYISEAPGSYMSYAPAIAEDGTIYLTTKKIMTAIQPDGTIAWQVPSGYAVAPAIADDGTIYTSHFNTLMAYDPNGTETWSLEFTDLRGYLGIPALSYDGTLYLGASQTLDGRIRAVKPSGELLWEYGVGSQFYAPPIVGLDGTIYTGNQERGLYAISPDGEKKWTYGISFDHIDAPPVTGPDNTVYCVQKSGLIHALNPDGTVKWTYKTQPEAISSPIIGPDGAVEWKFRGLLEKTTPLIDADGILYAPGADSTIVAIDEGTELWRYNMGISTSADIKLGPDGTLYAFCQDGYLYAIRTESPGYPSEACWPCIFGNNNNVNRLNNSIPGGVVVGTVTNPEGKTVENVLVTLEPGGLSASSSADGSFSIRGVEPGTYTLTASAFGIVTEHIEGIGVEAGRTTAVDIQVVANDYSLKWTFDTHRDDIYSLGGAIVYSVALGHDGTVYVDNEFNLFAVSPEGEELWMARLEGSGKSISVGADSTIYLGTEGEALQAFSPGGIELWRYDQGRHLEGTPSIGPNGRIYAPFDRDLCCFGLDGTIIWTKELDHCVNTAAIAYDGTLYAGTNLDTFYALSPEGKVLWTGEARGNPPSLGSDGTVYTADGAMLRAMSPDGVELWSYKADNTIWTSCAIDSGNNIYFGDNAGTFHALDNEGHVLWKYDAGGMLYSSPAIGSDGIIYFGDSNGIFHALNPDGTAKWTFRTGSAINGSPAIADDGTVYIGSFDSLLYAFQTTSCGYQEGASWPCYCHDSQRTSYMSKPHTVSVEDAATPTALSLLPVQPNPFNMSATIPFMVRSDGHVTLAVYNLAGQCVRTLVDDLMTSGTHRVAWDGHDDAGQTVAAGVYLSRLEAKGTVVTDKMMLVK